MLLLWLMAGGGASLLPGYWALLGDRSWQARLRVWVFQGCVFPAGIWAVITFGVTDVFHSVVPEILELQRNSEPWLGTWFEWFVGGAVLIGLHWLSVTYFWLLGRIMFLAPDKKEFWLALLILGVPAGLLAAGLVYLSDYPAAALGLSLFPLVHFMVHLSPPPAGRPSYSVALARMKFGKYSEAEWEVIKQLEKEENDFEGWMMLADLYARQKRNVEDAVRVVWDICRDPATQPYQMALACHQLADWQLQIAGNPSGARAAMEHLERLLPNSHFAKMARQRLQHIPSSVEELEQSRQPKKIRLPILREEFTPPELPRPFNESKAVAEANRLSRKLTDNPNNFVARQDLATVLAEQLGDIELATEQLELLLALEEPSDEQKALWSVQIAQWQYSKTRDEPAFQSALHELIRQFPQTAQAFAAQRRLSLLEMNSKPQKLARSE